MRTPVVLSIAACAACGTRTPAASPSSDEAQPVEAAPVDPIDPVDPAAAAAFQGLVRDSARAIKGCYNAAQSAEPALRSREILLTITADFEPSGRVGLSLQPPVSESFAECVTTRTAGWKVAVTSRMTFRASLKLTP